MEAILFFIFGGLAVVGGLAMVFSKNAVHSALFLLLSMTMIAGLYVLLSAQFIAVAQIMVYAGAIVVLILFVVMLLGAELGETIPQWLTVRNGVMVLLALIFLTVSGTAVYDWLYSTQPVAGTVTDELIAQQGSAELVGQSLFTQYLLPFELASILLLVGIVGVVMLGGWRFVQHRERGK
ncbi:MAG TPA: NADH-quinone oxidoreductase subunit J [Anaerolineae bacterium]|nr:NADH-quinone oxidoreductase subunit J [Anaerolineae bacterium]